MKNFIITAFTIFVIYLNMGVFYLILKKSRDKKRINKDSKVLKFVFLPARQFLELVIDVDYT